MRYSNHADDIFVHPDDLWAFAWSAPMRDLAERIGISDVGLKKLLRSHGVSTPPQGYWNRVKAEQPVPKRPKTPERRPGEEGRIRLDVRFAKVLTDTQPIPVDGPFASQFVPEDLEELRAIELKALGRITVPRDLTLAHPGLVQLLKREQKLREKQAASSYSWNAPKFDAPFGQRKLRLLNGLFLALAERGHSGDAYERDGELHARAFVGDTHMAIVVDVAGKKPKPDQGYRRPAHDLPLSTPLAIWIDASYRGTPAETWRDDDEGKLESKLAAITAGVIVAGEATFRRRLREHQVWLERMRQLDEQRRHEQLAGLEAKRLEELRRSGNLLREAEEIRTLVQKVKAAVLAGTQLITKEDLGAWEEWAMGYADRIDPIKSGQVLSHLRAPSLPNA